MSHRTPFHRAFNGGALSREPTLAERIALALMDASRRAQPRPPVTIRKFSWQKDGEA